KHPLVGVCAPLLWDKSQHPFNAENFSLAIWGEPKKGRMKRKRRRGGGGGGTVNCLRRFALLIFLRAPRFTDDSEFFAQLLYPSNRQSQLSGHLLRVRGGWPLPQMTGN